MGKKINDTDSEFIKNFRKLLDDAERINTINLW